MWQRDDRLNSFKIVSIMASDAQNKHHDSWFGHASVALRFIFVSTSLFLAYHYYSPASSSHLIPSLFSLHVAGMALGVMFFMPEAILSAMQMRRGLVGEKRDAAALLHVILTVSGLVFVLGGFLAIYANKNEMKKQHFTSLHSQFGLAFLLLSLGASSGGLLSWRPLASLSNAILPSFVKGKVKMVHRWAGTISWIIGLVTIEIILFKPSMYTPFVSELFRAGVAFTGIIMIALSASA